MKLVTIMNKYIFGPDPQNPNEKEKYKPNGSHIYAAYTDKKTNKTRLVQMTHLYEDKKVRKIKQGLILPVKLPNVQFPSGVKREYYDKDIHGKPIDLKKVKAANVLSKSKKATYLSKPLADKITKFATKKHK